MSTTPWHICNLVYACPLKVSLEIRKLIVRDMKRTAKAKASAKRINMLLPWSTPALVNSACRLEVRVYATFLCITLGTPLLVCLAYRFSSIFRKWFRGSEQILTGMYLEQLHCCGFSWYGIYVCWSDVVWSSDGRFSSFGFGNRMGTSNGELPQTHLLFIFNRQGPQLFHFYPLAHLNEPPIPSNFFFELRIPFYEGDWISYPLPNTFHEYLPLSLLWMWSMDPNVSWLNDQCCPSSMQNDFILHGSTLLRRRCAYVHALQHTHLLNKTTQWYDYIHFCGFDVSSIKKLYIKTLHINST